MSQLKYHEVMNSIGGDVCAIRFTGDKVDTADPAPSLIAACPYLYNVLPTVRCRIQGDSHSQETAQMTRISLQALGMAMSDNQQVGPVRTSCKKKARHDRGNEDGCD